MSSFQFSDEEKPQPAAPPPVTPPAASAQVEEEDDDFSFLAQPPVAPASQTPPVSPTPAPATPASQTPSNAPSPAAQRQAQLKAQMQAQGQAMSGPAPAQSPRAAAPTANAPQGQASATKGDPSKARPLRPAQSKAPGVAASTGAAPMPSLSIPAPEQLHPVGVPNPQAAPNPAAAQALTPTPTTPAAEELTGMETGEKINAGLYGVGSAIRQVLNVFDGPASWALRVSIVVGGLCLAFLLAATLFGGAGNLAANPKAAELVKNLGYAAKGLSVALVVASISAILISYEDNKLGVIIVAIAVALEFGVPLALKAVVGDNSASGTIAAPLRQAGVVLFVVGIIKATIDLFDFLFKLPDRIKMRQANVGTGRPTEAKQRAIASKASMMSPCWQLPFCREAIRVLCPAFIAKKTCWKFGRGCYCDEEMIARIVRGEPMESIKAPTRISQSKPPCGRCYIYLEHQTYKFRMLSPLALPATILVAFLGYPLYAQFFKLFDKGLSSLWGSLSFSTSGLTPEALQANPEAQKAAQDAAYSASQVQGIAQTLIGIMLGFFLLIYITKSIEWAIFKAKL